MKKHLKNMATKKISAKTLLATLLILLFANIIGFTILALKINKTQKEISEKNISFENRILALEENLTTANDENAVLADALQTEKSRSDNVEQKLGQITGTVDTLERLSETDPELLQKYSKVSFLNEHYTPRELTKIDSQYLYDKNKKLEIHDKVWPFLEKLLRSAEKDGVDLQIISAFRSFSDQAVLKTGYTFLYGAGTANQFSADQGYSEHQLGTTVDFTTPKVGASFNNFEDTEAFEWLMDNAYKFGFIISYPKGNSYYQYEPWHWRFVGESLARKLKQDGTTFYNTNQRIIDQYLADIWED